MPTAAAEQPTETPVPPTETPEPTLPRQAQPTQAPSPPPAATTQPAVQMGPVTLNVAAHGIAFAPSSLTAHSGASVTVVLNNQDALVPHDVSLIGIGKTEVCTGPCIASVSFTAPAPGNYRFMCTVHPDMLGTLTVSY